ncbi:Os07g0300100 [Oryza sativa Japonica Group]|uniref:Os07g0300100 protein n=1 Tax=Oryza sativa subsp. japonica TaxID=39947 RepID=A0A0P0X4V1_ORYSJ|nr:Os07g0300100 [Oryza sativa Japonica Group]
MTLKTMKAGTPLHFRLAPPLAAARSVTAGTEARLVPLRRLPRPHRRPHGPAGARRRQHIAGATAAPPGARSAATAAPRRRARAREGRGKAGELAPKRGGEKPASSRRKGEGSSRRNRAREGRGEGKKAMAERLSVEKKSKRERERD